MNEQTLLDDQLVQATIITDELLLNSTSSTVNKM